MATFPDNLYDDGQRIEGWSVVKGRLVGAVYNRPGHRDGGMIVTSPVVEVRLLGEGTWTQTYPVAFTESGTAYRMGRPSHAFGMERAEQFVHAKLELPSSALEPAASRFDPLSTMVRAAVDASLHNFDCIDVYETSFRPL